LKQEILNSEKLKSHFEDNPDDLKILRHDKAVLHPMRKIAHLKHIPSYLIPQGLVRGGTDPSLSKKKKRKRGGVRRSRGVDGQKRRKDNDPLQSFQAAASPADDSRGGDAESVINEGAKKKIVLDDRIFDESEPLGKSSAGRLKWKMKHKKGKFSAKNKKKARGGKFGRSML